MMSPFRFFKSPSVRVKNTLFLMSLTPLLLMYVKAVRAAYEESQQHEVWRKSKNIPSETIVDRLAGFKERFLKTYIFDSDHHPARSDSPTKEAPSDIKPKLR